MQHPHRQHHRVEPGELQAPLQLVCALVVEKLATSVGREFPRSVFFAGKLVFQRERWYQRLLHNESAYQLQRRLQFAGLDAMVLPVRVLQSA